MIRRAAWLAASCCLGLACDDERARPLEPPCNSCSDAGTAGAGGSAGSGSAGEAGSTALDDAGPGDEGGDGDAAVHDAVCGNGVREAGEACDGPDLGELTCASFGYSDGTLSCVACSADSTACSGTEVCADGNDNDGDSSVDCADPDCAEICADFCVAPTPLAQSLLVSGAILGQVPAQVSSCSPADSDSSGQVIFVYEPPVSGVADVFVDAEDGSNLALSVRPTCREQNSEVACSATTVNAPDPLARINVTAGETLYLVVESSDRTTPTSFQIVATAREVACGDGFVDLDEECDDGNFEDDDGCSTDCVFQSDEDEPNGTLQNATPYTQPEFFGSISNEDDVDVVSIEVGAGQQLIAETLDLGDGACAQLALDNWIDVLDGSGEVVASDDDAGTGFCAAVVTAPLSAGTYYVRTRASGTAERFFYRLQLSLQDPD
jgi:cysteine-rich repeat protein